MCDPVTAAVLAGSTGASILGGNLSRAADAKNTAKRIEAANAALKRTLERTDPLADEARGLADTRIAAFQPDQVEGTRAASEDARTRTMSDLLGVDTPDIPFRDSAPDVVRKTSAARMADSIREATDQARATAKLRSFGDIFFDNAIDQGRSRDRLRTIGDFVGGEFGLLSDEQQIADLLASSKGGSTLGSILSGLGRVGSQAAGAGVFS